jgi:hypothetical protein
VRSYISDTDTTEDKYCACYDNLADIYMIRVPDLLKKSLFRTCDPQVKYALLCLCFIADKVSGRRWASTAGRDQ